MDAAVVYVTDLPVTDENVVLLNSGVEIATLWVFLYMDVQSVLAGMRILIRVIRFKRLLHGSQDNAQHL